MRIDLFTYKPGVFSTDKSKNYQSKPDFNSSVALKQPLRADTISFGYDVLTKKIPNLHCPYCGREMFTEKQINEFTNTVTDLKGQEAVEKIENYTKELKQESVPQKVSILLINELKKSPQITVNEAIRHLIDENEVPTLQKQIQCYKKILEKSNKLPQNQREKIKSIVPPPDIEILKKVQNKEIFKRKKIINEIKSIINTEPDQKVKSNLSSILKESYKLPTAKYDVGTFIVKYGNSSSKDFMYYMVAPLRTTADHMFLNKNVKTSDQFDLISACEDCNWERGDTPFSQWMAGDDRHVTNFANHIKELTQVYAETKDKNLLNYIGNITITMTNALLGKNFKILNETLKPDVKND